MNSVSLSVIPAVLKLDYGARVQYSVFADDSIRIYALCAQCKATVNIFASRKLTEDQEAGRAIMSKKIVSAILILLTAYSVALITGCVSVTRTGAPVYYANTITIRLKSSPPGAAVILDGIKRGFTPLNLKITFLDSRNGVHESETQNRILKIEKEGYKPYVMVFSIKDKSYKEIPDLIRLKSKTTKPLL